MKKRLLLLAIAPVILLLAVACPGPTQTILPEPTQTIPPEPILLGSKTDYLLHEDYYHYFGPITLSDNPTHIVVYFDLRTWDGDYSLELMLMTESDFEDFQTLLGTYRAYHRSCDHEGSYTWDLYVDPGVYYFVVDNTDKGWESTDLDGEDDIALFDYSIYQMPY